jgi:hypothetical protein
MEYNLTKVEELFGTLQQSVVATWRKHLKTTSYSKHMALDEFYDEMPEKVDKLIEDYIAEHENIEEYINILDSKPMDALEYLETLKALCEEGREKFLAGSSALESDMDDILGFIDGIIYKVRQLKEGLVSLSSYLKENCEEMINEGKLGVYLIRDTKSDIVYVVAAPTEERAKLTATREGTSDNLEVQYLKQVMCMGPKSVILAQSPIKMNESLVKESWDDDEYEIVTWAKEIDPDIFDDVAYDGANEIDDFDNPDPKQVRKLFGRTNTACILYHMDGDDADIRLLSFSKKMPKSDPKIKNLMKKIEDAGYFDCYYFFPNGV